MPLTTLVMMARINSLENARAEIVCRLAGRHPARDVVYRAIDLAIKHPRTRDPAAAPSPHASLPRRAT